MSDTSFRGPVYGNQSSMAGALDGVPLDLFAKTKWVSYFNDFILRDSEYDETTDWQLTQVSLGGSASIVAGLYDFGALRLDCPANLDGPIVQLDSGASASPGTIGVRPVAGTSTVSATDAVFASRFKMRNVSGSGIFVGLAELQGTSPVMATPTGGVTSENHIGFSQISTDNGSLTFTVTGNSATAVTTPNVITIVDDEWIEVAVRARGIGHYSAYINTAGNGNGWTKVADGQLASGSTWESLQMMITLVNIGSAANDDLDIDYVMFSTKRDSVA